MKAQIQCFSSVSVTREHPLEVMCFRSHVCRSCLHLEIISEDDSSFVIISISSYSMFYSFNGEKMLFLNNKHLILVKNFNTIGSHPLNTIIINGLKLCYSLYLLKSSFVDWTPWEDKTWEIKIILQLLLMIQHYNFWG